MISNKILFAGCSYTAGNGWTDTTPEESTKIELKDSPHLWVNICHSTIDRFKNLELINVGKGGASNTEIFENATRAMIQHGDNVDTVFCQWTSMPRYNWHVGFELWDTSENLGWKNLNLRTHDQNLNRGDTWSRKHIQDLTDQLRVMHHLHWEIVKVVDYTNMILTLAKRLGINQVLFINGLCPWDAEYFSKLDNVKPEAYTEFTKQEILNIDTRDDADILQLYNLAHQHYLDRGGIQQSSWINLYDSFRNLGVDTNYDKSHPGVVSNRLYAEIIKQKLQSC